MLQFRACPRASLRLVPIDVIWGAELRANPCCKLQRRFLRQAIALGRDAQNIGAAIDRRHTANVPGARVHASSRAGAK